MFRTAVGCLRVDHHHGARGRMPQDKAELRVFTLGDAHPLDDVQLAAPPSLVPRAVDHADCRE